MDSLAREVGDLLRRQGLTLGTVESATGGLMAHRITDIPGSSDYYRGSVIAYKNGVKIEVVGVREETISEFGAVSPQVAEEMARGGREVLAVDICLADTGIAGPGGATADKPVGLFYLGLSHKGGTWSRRHLFTGSRLQNKKLASTSALIWLRDYLTGLK
jgi:PncC family amidohydrolase